MAKSRRIVRKPLSAEKPHAPTRLEIASAVTRALRRSGVLNRGGYKVVHGKDQLNREWSNPETGDETQQLTASERNRIIAMARNLMRNSEQMEAILHQFEINVVGVEGGKAVFDFGEGWEKESEAVKESFAEWARAAEYFDDLPLRKLLKLTLRTQLIGGDIVLVFDDAAVSGSGQVVAFEPDCIGDIPDAEFKKIFPGCTQHQGVVKDANGKTVGAIVSWTQRGKSQYAVYDEKGRLAIWPLKRPDGVSWLDSPFYMHRGLGRFNQVRGSSGLWSALGTLADLTALQTYELQSSKRNSQVIGQVTQEKEDAPVPLPNDLNPDATAPIEGGDDVQAAVNQGIADAQQEPLQMDHIDAAQVIYDLMPPGAKMELFDTVHPNGNFPAFVSWLRGSAAWTRGIARCIATGECNASYSASMAEMLMSQKAFDEEWQDLRPVLDWIIRRWYAWATRTGRLRLTRELPANWMRWGVKWQRPKKRAINPVDEQNAWTLGLKNGTVLYSDIDGPDWKIRALKREEELKFYREHGIPHPADETASGQRIETNDNGDRK